jgi:hypothetical protein
MEELRRGELPHCAAQTAPQKRRPTIERFCALDHVLVSLGGDAHGFVDTDMSHWGFASQGRRKPSMALISSSLSSLVPCSRACC